MIFKICKWLFLLLIISLPLVRPFNTQIFGLQVPFTDFIFLAVLVFWLLAMLRGETRFRFDKLYIFIGLYALTLTISTVFSIHPEKSFYKLLGEFYLFGLAVVAFNLVQDRLFFKKVLMAWLIGTGLTILGSIAGFGLFFAGFKNPENNYFLSHFGSLPSGNYPRIYAFFANFNMLCNFLNVGLMLAVLAEKLGWLKKIWARILLTGIGFAAVFTFSPGLGGLVLSLGIWFRALFKENKKPLIAKVTLAAAIIIAAAVFGATLVSPDTDNTAQEFTVPFSDKKLEASVRVLVWEDAIEKFSEFPITGRGTGANTAARQYRVLSGGNQLLGDAHNVWLNVLGQTGLLGIISFILLNLFLLTRCRFTLDKLDEQNYTHLALSCAVIGAFFYQGLSGSFEDARHLWVLFGMLAAISKGQENL